MVLILTFAFLGFLILLIMGLVSFIKRKNKPGKHKTFFKWSAGLLALSFISFFFVDETKSQPTAELAAQEEAKAEKAKEKEEEKAAKEKDEAAKAKAEKEAKEKAAAKKKENNSIENKVKKAVHKSFGEKNDFDKKDSIVELSFNKDNGYLSVQVFGQDSLTTNMIKTSMWIEVTDVLDDLSKEEDIKNINFGIVFPMQDQYGKESNDTVMTLSFSRETIDKIDFGNFQHDNIPNVADEYWHHPVFNK